MLTSSPRSPAATRSSLLSQLAHVNVDVEIDPADTNLLGLVGAASMPASIARAGILDVGKFQAPPLRQPAAAFAGKLPGQHDLFAASVGADDVRTQFAGTAVIAAHDLPFGEDGVAEEGVGGAGHRGSLTIFVLSDTLRSEIVSKRTPCPTNASKPTRTSWAA